MVTILLNKPFRLFFIFKNHYGYPGENLQPARYPRTAPRLNGDYRHRLLILFENEINERLLRHIERQLKESGLPAGKTLEALDENKLPDKVRRQLPTLLTGELVGRGDNLLCFGLPGCNNPQLAAALGREWRSSVIS